MMIYGAPSRCWAITVFCQYLRVVGWYGLWEGDFDPGEEIVDQSHWKVSEIVCVWGGAFIVEVCVYVVNLLYKLFLTAAWKVQLTAPLYEDPNCGNRHFAVWSVKGYRFNEKCIFFALSWSSTLVKNLFRKVECALKKKIATPIKAALYFQIFAHFKGVRTTYGLPLLFRPITNKAQSSTVFIFQL